MQKLRWGVLSSAKIGRTKVIPAIQTSLLGEVVAIASRSQESADKVAKELGIKRAHASYEALLADPDVDAIYNPLPNHLHVPWSIKAIEAGKHVLCEKPLGLNTADVEQLIKVAQAHPQLSVMEAFMYRFHPQWQTAKKLVREGRIGQVRSIHSHFAYNNRELDNIRNNVDWGGGALMDIGCYCISLSRFIYDAEPSRVIGQITPFAGYDVDCFVSGIMEFAQGNATFTATTKSEGEQYVEIHGEQGSILIPLPFNPIADTITHIELKRDGVREQIVQLPSDHYRNMADAFAESVNQKNSVPTPLNDALANMKIIDAIFASAKDGCWFSIK
ncbi:deoxyfructose oxidoreductase [Cellvibrio zantedeschiae]|uniref:Deoxyfructose oxidoreductase n=1 Tax=Cellvibrio zantedeschiae TaxID=1237077 RepID=A0ABQ3ANA9_9GAMM|nr:Gfo/Idh/MocA family oxidoreductase [Cellvibrio zantedeschiae]GGY61978.1 deoxyfructose oxidoreductase [Cellvibrio zantedeschiae]